MIHRTILLSALLLLAAGCQDKIFINIGTKDRPVAVPLSAVDRYAKEHKVSRTEAVELMGRDLDPPNLQDLQVGGRYRVGILQKKGRPSGYAGRIVQVTQDEIVLADVRPDGKKASSESGENAPVRVRKEEVLAIGRLDPPPQNQQQPAGRPRIASRPGERVQ